VTGPPPGSASQPARASVVMNVSARAAIPVRSILLQFFVVVFILKTFLSLLCNIDFIYTKPEAKYRRLIYQLFVSLSLRNKRGNKRPPGAFLSLVLYLQGENTMII
jgi:hypothetical protein